MRQQEDSEKRPDPGLHVGHEKIQRLQGPNPAKPRADG
jgi:hypothetical protein